MRGIELANRLVKHPIMSMRCGWRRPLDSRWRDGNRNPNGES